MKLQFKVINIVIREQNKVGVAGKLILSRSMTALLLIKLGKDLIYAKK